MQRRIFRRAFYEAPKRDVLHRTETEKERESERGREEGSETGRERHERGSKANICDRRGTSSVSAAVAPAKCPHLVQRLVSRAHLFL
jgi:hypothetical protein